MNKNIRDWKSVSLGEIFDFKNGLNADKTCYGTGIKFINIMEIIKNTFITADMIPGLISVEEYKVCNNIVKYGDILFNRTSETAEEIGLSSVYLDTEPVTFGGFVIKASSRNSLLDHHFKKYFLRTNHTRKKIIKSAQGVVRMNIGQSDLSKITVCLPSISEQQRIASILEIWDQAIDLLSHKIEVKQQNKKGLMHRLLTGKVRFKGFNGQWKKSEAGMIFKNISLKNFPNEELLSATQDMGIIPRRMLKGRVTMPTGIRNSYKLVEPGNFVISLRSFQGGLEYSSYKGIVSPAYTVLSERKQISKVFYKYYFKSNDFISRLNVAVIGIRDGKQINYDDFCSIYIPDPEIEEQSAIASILTKADEEINLLLQKKEYLEQQKKFLLNNLMTGQIRVPITIHN